MTEGTVRLAHVVRHPACIAGLVALIFTLALLALAAALVWRPARDAAASAD